MGRQGRAPADGICFPFFPVRRVRADSFLCQWCLHHRAIDALPSPRDTLHLVVIRQACLQDCFKEAHLLPFEKVLVNGAGAAKALSRQCPPVVACAQHKHDGLEHLACRICRPSCSRLANVLFVRYQRALRDQQFHTLSELIRYHPQINSFAQRITPTPRSLQLGVILIYLRIISYAAAAAWRWGSA